MSKTVGQLERELSQQIQAFYRDHLGHRPSQIVCQLFNSTLAIVLEDAVTSPEKLLEQNGRSELAETVNSALSDAMKPKLIQLIEDILQVKVMDLLSDTTLETGRRGIIVILADTPMVRNPGALPKYKPTKAESSESAN